MPKGLPVGDSDSGYDLTVFMQFTSLPIVCKTKCGAVPAISRLSVPIAVPQ